MLDHLSDNFGILSLCQCFHRGSNQEKLLLQVVKTDSCIDFVPVLDFDLEERRFDKLGINAFIVQNVEQTLK